MQVVTPVLIPTVVTPFTPPGKPSEAVSRAETEATTFSPIEKPTETSAKRASEPSPSASEELARTRQQEIVQEQQAGRENKQNELAQQKEREQQQELEQQKKQQQEQQDLAVVRALAKRDREVRAHEQAHQAVGGRFAGAASFTFERGPDGVAYAVGGEVPIDTSSVANSPEATILKAQTIRRAALAPANPSAQDRAVAAQATQVELQARQDLVIQQREEAELAEAERAAKAEQDTTTEQAEETAQASSEEGTEALSKVAEAQTDAEQSAETGDTQTDLNRRNLSIYEEFTLGGATSDEPSNQSPVDLTA